MNKALTAAVIGVFLVFATATSANVFNMGGTRNADGSWTGLASLETVPVGNPGNAGELSGTAEGGYGPARICGSVSYEYRIGKYEVTAGQYTEFLNKVAGVDTYGLYNTAMSDTSSGGGITQTDANGDGLWEYSVASDFANRPVNYVSWGDSARFANWLHNGQPTGAQNLSTTEDGAYYLNGATSNAALMAVNRKTTWKWAITSEDEWYKAAYHKNDGVTGNYFDYPTSSDTAPERDMTDVSGNNANRWWMGSSYPIDSGKYTTVVGEFQNSDSPYGTFDQGGNVHEWNEAILVSGLSRRGLRGGAFYDVHGSDLLMHAAYRWGDERPALELNHIGFRVSEVPEPASMALLALGGLGMLVRRRGVRA